MRVDLRVKHDVEARKAAIGLFELGHGYKSAAIALSLPAEAVRRWREIYRAFGSEVLLRMDGKDSRQDRAQDDARDGDSLRYQTRDGLPQVQLVQGRRRQDVRERDQRDFDAGAPWRKLGTNVTEFKVAGGKAYWAPTLDFFSKEIVASDISPTPDMAQQARMLDELLPKVPEGAAPTMHSDRGWQYQHASYTSRLESAGIVQSMFRKANCNDNAATEQLFGHVKDEFCLGREWKTFEDFKRDLEEYIVHWSTSRRQVRLKGLTPVDFRSQALAA